LEMPLSTMLFRLGRLERRGHAERAPNPNDRRSYLIRLTKEGERLLGEARPAFRDYALAVEGRLGSERVESLRAALEEVRDAGTEPSFASGWATSRPRSSRTPSARNRFCSYSRRAFGSGSVSVSGNQRSARSQIRCLPRRPTTATSPRALRHSSISPIFRWPH